MNKLEMVYFNFTWNTKFVRRSQYFIQISVRIILNLDLVLERFFGVYFTLWIYIIYGFHFLKWVTKNIDLFQDILIILDVPVHLAVRGQYVYVGAFKYLCASIRFSNWQSFSIRGLMLLDTFLGRNLSATKSGASSKPPPIKINVEGYLNFKLFI